MIATETKPIDAMAQGIVPNMPEAEYHAHPAWSQSALKLLPDEPELFHGRHILKLPDWQVAESDDIWLGTCLHAMHLQGQEIVRIPSEVLTSNGQRRGTAWKAWEAEHAGELVLRDQDAERVNAMSAGLMADPTIQRILKSDGPNELSLFWTDEETGLDLRARIDLLREGPGGWLAADIKSTNIDVTDKRQVASKILDFGYHQQDAMYEEACRRCLGFTPAAFCFIFVRNKPPYNACLWRLNPNDIALGGRRNRKAMADLVKRLVSGDWSNNRAGQVNEVSLPKYAYEGDDGATYYADDFQQFTGEEIT